MMQLDFNLLKSTLYAVSLSTYIREAPSWFISYLENPRIIDAFRIERARWAKFTYVKSTGYNNG